MENGKTHYQVRKNKLHTLEWERSLTDKVLPRKKRRASSSNAHNARCQIWLKNDPHTEGTGTRVPWELWIIAFWFTYIICLSGPIVTLWKNKTEKDLCCIISINKSFSCLSICYQGKIFYSTISPSYFSWKNVRS